MQKSHKIIFYPVGNGDTTQIVLTNGKRVLFDFCHREKSEETETPEINLKTKLRNDLDDAGQDYFDVVAFTHADLDHIQGSTDFFELQHSSKYQGNGRITIRQLWVPAAMLLEEASKDQRQDEFVLLREEAKYRLLKGKDILVFSKPQALMDWLVPKLKARGEAANSRDHLFIDAGTLVPGFSLGTDNVEFFCHSPFIKHCDEGDVIRNSAALIFNIRLRVDEYHYDYLAVGDAEWSDLEDIILTTRYHKNNDRLAWDLFNIPHHCSYKALSDEKGEHETAPTQLVKELLLQGKKGSYIVSCSKPITDVKAAYSEIQPPHIQARKAYERYLNKTGGRSFLVTMEEPNALKPKPIEFEISRGGISWLQNAVVGAPALMSTRPPRAG